MGRPRLHDDRTERELLAAAEVLLAEGGAGALSVRRLAEAAGTTPRAIYSRFGGKDGLLQALFREAFHALAGRLDALPLTGDPVADLVDAGVCGFRAWALERPDLFRLAFEDWTTPVRPADTEAGVQAFARLRSRIAHCVRAGALPAGCEAELGLAFHGLCEGLASLETRRRFPPFAELDPESMWRSALLAVVRGYAQASTEPRPPPGP